jgi:hypothetical protein
MSRKPLRSASQPAPQQVETEVTWRDEVHPEHGHQFMVPSSVDAVMPEFKEVMRLDNEQTYKLLYGLCSVAVRKLLPDTKPKYGKETREEIAKIWKAVLTIENVLSGDHGP